MSQCRISTGSDLINDFLEGGFEKDILTTIYGPASSGKTTLCKLASIAQARAKKKVIYIDAEGGFSLDRMKQLTGDDIKQVLDNILLLKPVNFEEQGRALYKLKTLINEKIGLIVVDTLTIFYRLELAKSDEIKPINKMLISQVSYLNEIARKKNIPILITNQVYADFKNKDQVKMVGGDILKYNSKCLINLKVVSGNKRKASLITHRSIPEGKEIDFAIINEGFV